MPLLRPIAGEHIGTDFPIGDTPLLIGRRTSNSIVISHTKASRSHAEVSYKDGKCYIRDLDSSNGTFVNGIKIAPSLAKELEAGDEIRVTDCIFRYFDSELNVPNINIPGHTLIEVIAQGGMGTIYRARQTSMDRDVAIKILSDKYSRRKEFVNRFIQEARAAGKLSHPNIIQVHNVGKTDDNHYYFTMELVSGANLTQRMANRDELTIEDVVNMAIHVADALEYAHDNGVIHRDIKPDNIIISDSGEVKVADLGIAKLAESPEKNEGQKRVLGTPHYMSPEQASGKKVDNRTDLYSLGASLYHILSGEPIFDSPNSTEVMTMHVREAPEPLSAVASDVPDPICDVIDRLLQKDPDDRYQTAGDLRVAFENALKAGGKRKGTKPKDVAAKPRRMDTRASAPSRASRKGSGNSAAQMLVFGGIVAVILIVGIIIMNGSPSGGSSSSSSSSGTGGNSGGHNRPKVSGSDKAMNEADSLFNAKKYKDARAKYDEICVEYSDNQDIVSMARNRSREITNILSKQNRKAEVDEAWADYLKYKEGHSGDLDSLESRVGRIAHEYEELRDKADAEKKMLTMMRSDKQNSLFRIFEESFSKYLGRKDYNSAIAEVQKFKNEHADHPRIGDLDSYRDRAVTAANKEISDFKADVAKRMKNKDYTGVMRRCDSFANEIKFSGARDQIVQLRRKAEDALSSSYEPIKQEVYNLIRKRDYLGASNHAISKALTFINTPYQAKLEELEKLAKGIKELHNNTINRIESSKPWKVPESYNIKELPAGCAISGADKNGIKIKIGLGERPHDWDKLSLRSIAKIYKRYTPPNAADDLKWLKIFTDEIATE